MKLLLALFLGSFQILHAQNRYHYKADLLHIKDDKVAVQLITPTISEQEIVFSFPKVIPGSYNEKNFGKFIDDFIAVDKDGKKLKTNKLNPNQYLISNASTLASISYLVNDTWDKPDKDFIFQPGGSNIEAGNNVVMNNHAFYGYFEGYKKLPVEIAVTKPAQFFASTHMEVVHSSAEQDILKAPDYLYLVDNPVIYSIPDTTSFMIGNTAINICCVSVNKKVTSRQLAGYIKPVAESLDKFFGGLPVPSYQFLFYFDDVDNMGKKNMGNGYGALEHSYSSLYYLPEMPYEPRLKSTVLGIVSHEFLHILTPLNLHSEEIEAFDFISPKMSKHLWLYEGVSEYFSNLVQVQSGLITEKEFFGKMRKKISESEKFGNFSQTLMSEHVLEDEYKEKYSSVYSKGALTAMMLDILIRSKTSGAKDLKSVIMELTKKYGPGKPFKDNGLFAEIIKASHPDVRPFIDDYIVGDKPLAYAEFFAMVGYDFNEFKKTSVYFISKTISLGYNEENKTFMITEIDRNNALGIREGDELLRIEGNVLTDENLEQLWGEYIEGNTAHSEVTLTVRRKNNEKELTGKLYRGHLEQHNTVDRIVGVGTTQGQLLRELIQFRKPAN
ncbi:MAG: peptidase M61 [Bacteroidota bacterium]